MHDFFIFYFFNTFVIHFYLFIYLTILFPLSVKYPCARGQFTCNSSLWGEDEPCVAMAVVRDGHRNCADGSDEGRSRERTPEVTKVVGHMK